MSYNSKEKEQAYYHRNRKRIMAKMRLYYRKNKEKFYFYGKKHREKNREKISAYLKEYRKKNPPDREKSKTYQKEYYQKNKKRAIERIKKRIGLHRKVKREYARLMLKNNIQYRLKQNLRRRLSLAIKGKFKGGSAVRDLGCSIPELIIHLEKQFKRGMSWKNWSLYGWHIDHIIPFDAFDLTIPEQVKIVCHYTNLQPMWAKENIAKSNKIK